MNTVKEIRDILKHKYKNKEFTTDKTGVKTVEIVGCTFNADEEFILREPNYDYIKREIEWYNSCSLNVADIPGNTPIIWQKVSDSEGFINSNYGWCIFSNENGNQYRYVLNELKSNKDSRRAAMIYNRPSMHTDYNKNGMSDFMCTFANTFFIRDNKLHSHFIMRSNDAVFGYNNDRAWAKHVQEKLANDLKIEVGDLIWTASSLHVYERHFEFLE